MAPETDGERLDRIREAQINSRDRGSSKQPQSGSKSASKAPAKKKVAVQPKKKAVIVDRANTAANAIHDILVGAGIAAIPAVLAFIVLPGGFKLLGIVLLLGGAVVGYLRGETLA